MNHILVVEDSPTQAEQLRFILEEEGFAVELASDAEQALEVVNRQQVDLVVSDIVLPGASGFDLCKALKQRTTSVPVLMLSSLNDPLTIIRSLESGADYFLTKPYGPDHLVARIRTALSTTSARRNQTADGAVDVIFRGKAFSIRAEKEQMLDLLLSTFEDIIRTNQELDSNRSDLVAAKRQLERHALELEQLVNERTSELMDRQEQLSLAQKVARMGDWHLDVDNWVMNRSDTMCEVVGTTRSRENFDQALRRIHDDDYERVRQTIKRAVEEKSGFAFEARLVVKDGTERFVWFIGQPRIDTDGNLKELFGTAQDITDRKAMELKLLEANEQLYKAQKLEAVGQLTGGMAHDFNNLLAIIIGNLDLAQEHLSEPEAIQSIEEALSAALRGAELNKRLLAFAKRQALQPEPTDVNELVSETLKLLTRLLGARIHVTLDLAEDLALAFVDPSQLESAITNLVINARDAMAKGGVITVKTRTELMDGSATQGVALANGDYIVIEVSDTGTGIDPDLLARVCDPFFTTKAVGQGSGLGLSMVSGFLEQSGGGLAIDSIPGTGTTMRLYLPKASVQEAVSPNVDEQLSSPSRNCDVVLVAEDDDALRSVLIKQLHALGYSTIETASGDEALQVIKSDRQVDILFTDVVMPGEIDGIELVRSAKRIQSDLKIIVSSGFRGSHDLGVYSEAGVITLNKPYKKTALANALSRLCESPLPTGK